MDSIISALISALIVAALTGLGWIAYHHSEGFKRICRPLMFTAGAILALTTAYSIGVGQGFVATLPYLQPERLTVAEHASELVTVNPNVSVPTFIGFIAYLSFLYWLPELLGPKRKD